MTALCFTACIMAWPTASCFNCVYLPTKVFVSSILKTLANKLNILGVTLYTADGYIFSSLYSFYARLYQLFAVVSITLNFCISGSSGLGKLLKWYVL